MGSTIECIIVYTNRFIDRSHINSPKVVETIPFRTLLSSLIEVLQFVFKKGLCELDDVFHNVLGCMIGYWCLIAISQIAKKYKDKI